jgi:TRAP-type C4-dicarboxylate transport system permease small subunit
MPQFRFQGLRLDYLIPLTVLVCLFVVGIMQIISRFLFSLPFTWGEEVMRLFFVFLVFFGAIPVTANNEHLAVDLMTLWVKPRVSSNFWKIYKQGINFLQAFFLGLCAFGCFRMAYARWGTVSQTMSFWSIGYMYGLIGAALAGSTAVSIYHIFRKTPKG